MGKRDRPNCFFFSCQCLISMFLKGNVTHLMDVKSRDVRRKKKLDTSVLKSKQKTQLKSSKMHWPGVSGPLGC